MKTNDERVAHPFDSDAPDGLRLRLKPFKPVTRRETESSDSPDDPADSDIRSASFFVPQSSATPSAADATPAASRPASEPMPALFQRYLLIAACICGAAAAFGATAGFYIASISPPSLLPQARPAAARQDIAAERGRPASETMAMTITEMRRIASEELDDMMTMEQAARVAAPPTASPTLPPASSTNKKSREASMALQSNPVPGKPCSAASLALALCQVKPD